MLPGKKPWSWVVVLLCLTIATSSFAIEKRKKDAPSTKADSVKVVKSRPAPEPPKKQVAPSQSVKNPPVFNDFIDVNRNGIDDRLEKGGFVSPPRRPQQGQTQSPTTVKKPDTAKAEPVKKPVESPKVIEKKKGN